MGFAPLSNAMTSLSSRSIGPGRLFPTASLEIRRGSRPDSLSSTSSPASAFPQCCHHFGFEQQARIAFRPCRFARLRRFSPPIARVLTELFITVQGDEGLADLLRSAANRRVRCVSSTHPVESAPQAFIIADGVCCCSLGFAVPRIEVRTPRRVPPACSWSALQHPFGSRRRDPCLLGLFASFDPRPSR